MGVPAFFRWLSVKYPQIVVHCAEQKPILVDEVTTIPVDTSEPNPNKMEFDNLYLDMNGIIHPCTHPENKAPPKNEEEMFSEIFAYIDRIFSICRPRRVLYMAVDGVAPRAKMNQQRSRRFRSGKESREKVLTIQTIREELLLKGAKLPEITKEGHFDSNCITPGTPFMERLSTALQFYVYMKLTQDPGWRNLQVILSDAAAPGEGEHKIMDFIRRQRVSPSHDPNTRHCLCGADADLIMLGLATHEPYFTIIREEFKPNQPRPCEICGQTSHQMSDCQGLPSADFNVGVNDKLQGVDTEFIFIHLNVLREYLQQDLVMTNLPFKYDFERAVDDWVFMCFFVGNDFLPHLPSLEIREKAIDRLVDLYKSTVVKTKGWITDSGCVNLSRVQLMMRDLALVEDSIFQSRRDNELEMRAKQSQRRFRENRYKRQKLNDFGVRNSGEMVKPGQKFSNNDSIKAIAIQESKNQLIQSGSKRKATNESAEIVSVEPEIDQEDKKNQDLDKKDEVKLWEAGYRKRYYQSKFGVDVNEDTTFCRTIGHEYIRGLCWVLAYYYQGCPSWTWYYPYHYAPFAIDFTDVTEADVYFQPDSKPFNPLEQLMAVFPADSKSHVPPAWRTLMTDSESSVIDLYPTNFKVDLNGKRFEWQGVALLPFVDETRLLNALNARKDLLTEDEKRRNIITPDRYFIRSDHPFASTLKSLAQIEEETIIDSSLTDGITGRIWLDPSATEPSSNLTSPIPDFYPSIECVQVVSSLYRDPRFPISFSFPSKLLEKIELPKPTIGPNAVKQDRSYSYNTGPMNRMVNHSLNQGQQQNRPYNNQYRNQGNQYGRGGFNNNQYGRGNNNNQYGRGNNNNQYGRGGNNNNQYGRGDNNNNQYGRGGNNQFNNDQRNNPYYQPQGSNQQRNPYYNNNSNSNYQNKRRY